MIFPFIKKINYDISTMLCHNFSRTDVLSCHVNALDPYKNPHKQNSSSPTSAKPTWSTQNANPSHFF